METVSLQNTLPPEYTALYSSIYDKILSITHGGQIVNFRSDSTTLRVMIESTITIVESFKDNNGNSLSGPEKRTLAINILKKVVNDLAANGKIKPEDALEINRDIDFYGGLVIDVAITAANKALAFGKEFVSDAKKTSCKESCKTNCCLFG